MTIRARISNNNRNTDNDIIQGRKSRKSYYFPTKISNSELNSEIETENLKTLFNISLVLKKENEIQINR